ncbi:hypothetical protein LZI70_17445 [Vibrio pelagius]|uniref:CorA-like Mg2+ transporter protein n=1 Tax=Vibrio pelagius TaxID=28169 RepID=A0ABY5G886_VIBPE|nr:hypothetical protein [Vibrio pelagius]UTT86150.1 hypothetical protein LZI70_17445 [Vibrio pelagius]
MRVKSYEKISIPWVVSFLETHSRAKHFNSIISGVKFKSELLLDDLKSSRFKVFDQYSLVDFLDTDSVNFSLMFDERLSSFTLIYEFAFNINEESIEHLFSDNYYDHEFRHNFYNTVRNLLVQESSSSQIGDWASEVRKVCLDKIESIFKKNLSRDESPKIYKNTGNISLMVDGISEVNKSKYRNLILNSNQMAERVENNKITLLNNSEVEFAFHGRFHTIISSQFDDYYRYFPILYHAQFIWSAVHQFTSLMDDLNRKVLLGDFSNDSNIHIIDEYINKFELVRIHNQDMKMYFESDSESVFSKIESAWTIKESLDEINNYVSSFKEFIERSYQRKMERINRRQSTILFVISCIQTLGLVSIWGDYLSLSKVDSFVQTTGLIRGTDNISLLLINTWLPIILLCIIFVILYNSIFKK